jgi:hypothetical protein
VREDDGARLRVVHPVFLFALVLFAPVLYWNSQHDWLSFTYQLRQGFSPKQKAVPLKLLECLARRCDHSA